MIKNYNGTVDHSLLRNIRRLCEVFKENEKILMKEYEEKGEVSFYTELCPITGCPDEMSTLNTLKSEEEIKEFLKKDAKERIEGFLRFQNIDNNYLLQEVVKFVKENLRFPSEEEMDKIECSAEANRISNNPDSNAQKEKNTIQDVMKEILDLSELIMEKIREARPDDIEQFVEPYEDTLNLENEEFYTTIHWDRYYGNGNSADYSVIITFRQYKETFKEIYKVKLNRYSIDGAVDVRTTDWDEKDAELTIQCLIKIHKGIVKIAQDEDIQFISEIDYDKVVKE